MSATNTDDHDDYDDGGDCDDHDDLNDDGNDDSGSYYDGRVDVCYFILLFDNDPSHDHDDHDDHDHDDDNDDDNDDDDDGDDDDDDVFTSAYLQTYLQIDHADVIVADIGPTAPQCGCSYGAF